MALRSGMLRGRYGGADIILCLDIDKVLGSNRRDQVNDFDSLHFVIARKIERSETSWQHNPLHHRNSPFAGRGGTETISPCKTSYSTGMESLTGSCREDISDVTEKGD